MINTETVWEVQSFGSDTSYENDSSAFDPCNVYQQHLIPENMLIPKTKFIPAWYKIVSVTPATPAQ